MANTHLTRTISSGGADLTKWTWSCWVKRTDLVGGGNNYQRLISNEVSGNTKSWYIRFQNSTQFHAWSNNGAFEFTTNGKYRDINGWYHLVVKYDSTQSTEADRFKVYVNGEEPSMSAIHYPTLNETVNFMNTGNYIDIGYYRQGSSEYFHGLMSHMHFTAGYAYDASAFGSTDSTTGEWKINTSPSVTYGSLGFFILKDGNSLTDQSGEGNNFTVGGGTLTKTEDNPSNVFATWNPLQATTSASYDFVAGNTRMAVNDTAVFSLGATLAATTGKYYMEMKWVQQGGNGSWGMIPIDTDISNRPRNAGVGWNQSDNAPWLLGSIVSGSWGGSIGTSDIIQLAMDLDNGAFYFGKNGTYLNSGNPTSGASKTGAVDFSGTSLFGKQLTFAIGKGASGTDGWNANFGNGYFEQTAVSSAGTNASGNGIFEYDVPTGYTALSTKGLNL